MKTYIVLNIASIILLATAIFCFAAICSGTFLTTPDKYRKYFFKREAKGESVDEISIQWEKRSKRIFFMLDFAMVASFIAAFALSIVSVYLKSNFIGISLIVVLSLCLLIFTAMTFYNYAWSKAYRG
jgi:hypothetical protein